MVTLETIRQQLVNVLNLHDSPHRTALAFSIGVFIAFAPHYFFHTASVVCVAWAFRLNYLAVFLGSLVNNPWTVLPILAASLYSGLFLVGDSQPASIDWTQLSLENLFEFLTPFLWPFILGASTLALTASVLSYPIMRWILVTHHTKVKNGISSFQRTDGNPPSKT